MAYGFLPDIGTRNGPCEDEDCGHIDCAKIRKMAAEICPGCREPIGYERALILIGTQKMDHDDMSKYVAWHLDCFTES